MIDDPVTVCAALAIVAELRWSVARLHRRVGMLEDTKADKPGRKRLAVAPLLVFAFAACCLFSGCTQEQVARAEVAVANADRVTADMRAALDAARQAVTVAERVAQEMHAQEAAHQDQASADRAAAADRALAQVQVTVASAEGVVRVAEASASQAHVALDAAKSAQEGGAGTLETLLAAAVALVSGGAGGAALARRGVAGLAAALEVLADHGRRVGDAPDADAVAAEKARTLAVASSAGVAHLVSPRV